MTSTHNMRIPSPRPGGEGTQTSENLGPVRVEDIIGRPIGSASNGCSYMEEGHKLLLMRMPWERIVGMFERPNDTPDLAGVLGVPEGSPVNIVPVSVLGSVLRGVVVDNGTGPYGNRAEFQVTMAGRPSRLALAFDGWCERRCGGGRLTRAAMSVGRLLLGPPDGYVTVEYLGFNPDPDNNTAALPSIAAGQQLPESVLRDPNDGLGSSGANSIAGQL